MEQPRSSTLSTFKSKLKFKPNPLAKLYSISFGPNSKYHTQIRLGLSKLSAHLFQISVVTDPFCPNCPTNTKETPTHYFLECPSYAAQREEMLRGLRESLPPDILNNNKKLSYLLTHGSNNISLESNKNTFTRVHSYISDTGRFQEHH